MNVDIITAEEVAIKQAIFKTKNSIGSEKLELDMAEYLMQISDCIEHAASNGDNHCHFLIPFTQLNAAGYFDYHILMYPIKKRINAAGFGCVYCNNGKGFAEIEIDLGFFPR